MLARDSKGGNFISKAKQRRLAEQKEVRELLAVLKENNYSNAKDLLAAVRHVEELEQQLAGTMEQLAAMRQDLQEMQKSPLTSALQKTVHALEEKAEVLWGQIAALKENIIEGCKQELCCGQGKL